MPVTGPPPVFDLPVGVATTPDEAWEGHEEEPASSLDLLLDAGYVGPTTRPLLGHHRSPGRIIKTIAALLLVMAIAAGAVLVINDAVAATTPEGQQLPVVATYTRPGGETVDLRQVTCLLLARDIVTSGHAVENNPSVLAPSEIRYARPVHDQVAQVADLPKGDIAHQALTCVGRAGWHEGFRREVAFSLTVYGGESSMGSTHVRVRR